MKIAVVGAGYVGFTLALLLSKYNEVLIYDIDYKKVDSINNKKAPVFDEGLDSYIKKNGYNLNASKCKLESFNNADYIIIATPTDYNEKTNKFNTATVEETIKSILEINKSCTIIIKSTVPIGFTNKLRNHFSYDNIFSLQNF